MIVSDSIETAHIKSDAITTAKIDALAVGTAEIAAGAITTAKIAGNNITTATIAAGAVDTAQIAAGAVETAKIAANNITTATIAAGNIENLQIASDTIRMYDKAEANTMGNIEGTGGNDVSMVDTNNLVGSLFFDAAPFRISDTASSSADPTVAVGNVLGGTSDNANGSPLFSYNFTTPAFSGTRKYVIQVTLDPIGSYDSDSASAFAYAMRATTSSSAYTSTTASDYVSTRGTSIGGTRAGSAYNLNDVVNLSGNTSYYVWVFGQLEDVHDGGHPSIDHGILNGSIMLWGLSK